MVVTPGSADGEWNCTSCTYRNAASVSACGMCGNTNVERLALLARSKPQSPEHPPVSVPVTIHTGTGAFAGLGSSTTSSVSASASAPAAPVSSPADSKVAWDCPDCTFVNKPSVHLCEMCGLAKPGAVQPKSSSPFLKLPQQGSFSSLTLPPAVSPLSKSVPSSVTSSPLPSSATASTASTASTTFSSSAFSASSSPQPKPTLTLSPAKQATQAPSDALLAEILAMNCGFEIPEICEALSQTGNASIEAAVAYLTKIDTPPNKKAALASTTQKSSAVSEHKSPVCVEQKSNDSGALNDFVLKEYIRDFAAECPNIFAHVEEFIARMGSVGVTTEQDRARAFALLEQMKRDKEDTDLAQFLTQDESKSRPSASAISQEEQDLEFARRLERGEDIEMSDGSGMLKQDFVCPRCSLLRTSGMLFTNCSHILCGPCIKAIVASSDTPKCSSCKTPIHFNDVRVVCGSSAANKVADARTRDLLVSNGGELCLAGCGNVLVFHDNRLPTEPYSCPACKSINCFTCRVVHAAGQSCAQYKAVQGLQAALALMPSFAPTDDDWQKLREAMWAAQDAGVSAADTAVVETMLKNAPVPERGNSAFAQLWTEQKEPCQLFRVSPQTKEYDTVCKSLAGGYTSIVTIQRIQNPIVWANYQRYCERNPDAQEGFYWHGTRLTHPKVIYEKKGFDKTCSRIGGCLWFAVQSSYSMSGFQYTEKNGTKMVILALVAYSRRKQDVKFIRANQILNVYENSCTYPAYLITFR